MAGSQTCRQAEDTEAHDDTDGNCASIDRVVAHTLEDNTRSTNRMYDCRKTGFSKHNVSSTPVASVAPSTAIPTFTLESAGASLALSPVMAHKWLRP